MRTWDGPQVLQITIEVLFLSIKQRKQNLYRQTADLLTKKIAFDRVMLLRRLKEEELIVLKKV